MGWWNDNRPYDGAVVWRRQVPTPRIPIVIGQSVVTAASLNYPGIVVGIYISVHRQAVAVEVRVDGCRSLVAAG